MYGVMNGDVWLFVSLSIAAVQTATLTGCGQVLVPLSHGIQLCSCVCLFAEEAQQALANTVPLSGIKDPAFYDAVFLPGGHGPMFDLAQNPALADLLTKAYASGEADSMQLSNVPLLPMENTLWLLRILGLLWDIS